MAKYNSLQAWLRSAEGKNALGHDNFSHIEGLEEMKKIGHNSYSLEKGLSDFESAARNCGFGRPEYITRNGITTIIYHPTDQSVHMNDEDCPSVEINPTQGFLQISNNMPAANNPVFISNAVGKAGIASSAAVGLSESAKMLNQYSSKWVQQYARDYQTLARKMKTTTRISMNNVTKLNPSIYSKHVVGDYNQTLAPQNMDTLAVEGQYMMAQQGMLGFYNQSLFQKHKDGMNGFKGAPKSEQQFYRQLDQIMNVARGSDYKKLDSYVRQHFPWIYENVWKGELSDLYKSLEDAEAKNGSRITQGGKKEGAVGILGLAQDLIPLASFTNAGRKPQQNLRYFQNKKYHEAANAKNNLFTNKQYDLLSRMHKGNQNKIRQDLYYTGALNDSDWKKALDLIKKDYDSKKIDKKTYGLLKKELATKGLGKDASFISATASKDFRGMVATDILKGEIPLEDINAIIRDRLIKRYSNQSRNKGKTQKQIAQLADDELKRISALDANGKMSNDYIKQVKSTIRSLYGLNSSTSIGKFDFSDDKKSLTNIRTKTKLDNHIFKNVGGITDDRSTRSTMSDLALGYLFLGHGYRPEDVFDHNGKLKMHIGTQQQELSEKNIHSEIVNKFRYIISQKGISADSIQKVLENDQFKKLKNVVRYDKANNFWELVDSRAKAEYGEKSGKNTPFNFLQDIVRLGQELGIYQKGEAYSIKTLTDKSGKSVDYIRQNIALPDARESQVFSGSRYEDLGRETRSGSKFDWKTIASMRGSIGQMERMGISQEGIDAYRNYLQSIESKLAKKQAEYATYLQNLKVISQTYSKDINTFVNQTDKQKSTVIVPLEELMSVDSELNYSNNGYETGVLNSKNTLAARLYEIRNKAYKDLLKKNGNNKEALEKMGIFSQKDINVLGDYGEGRDIGHYDYDKNQFYSSRYFAFGTSSVDDEVLKGKTLNLDDVDVANYRILNLAKEYYRSLAGPDSKEVGSRVSRGIQDVYKDISESVERGSIFERQHTLSDDESSGYLLLSALGHGFSENFKEKYKKDIAPSMIVSAESAASMLGTALRGNDQSIKDQVYKMYADAFGIDIDQVKKIDQNKIVKDIINKYDYSRGGYQGDVLHSFQWLRNPIIKWAADSLGGGVAFSSDPTVANRGSMRINPDLAAAAKGDMDGDRVAFYIAALTGDTEAAREALTSYYLKLEKNQSDVRKKEALKSEEIKRGLSEQGLFNVENYGELDKANSIMDYYSQNVRSIATNEGAKGAGIYGDLVFAFEKILEEGNISQGTSGKNREVFLGSVASNIAHTLYQEGIAIKNMKTSNGQDMDESQIASVINEIAIRSAQSNTWESRRGMTDFLKLLEKTKMTDSEGVFKGNIIANLGLNNLDITNANDKEIIETLDQVANKELSELEKLYGKDSEEYKRLSADAERIKSLKATGGDLGNISRELLVALVTDSELGLRSVTGMENLGIKINQRYKYIPGKTHDFESMLDSIANNMTEDSLSEEVRSKYGVEIKRALAARKRSDERSARLRRATTIQESTTSPSAQTNRIAHSSLYGEKKDAREFERQVDLLVNGTDEEKAAAKEYLSQQIGINPDYKDLILSQVQGTYAHLASEHYMNAAEGLQPGQAIDKRAYKKSLMGEISARNLDAQNLALLKVLGFSADDARSFLRRSMDKGTANAAYLRNILAREGGQAIGSEVNLAGAGAINDAGEVQLSRQIADFLYKTVDEEGKTTFHVVDYKNTKDGKLHLANILQNTDYIESLRDLNNEILNNENFSAGAYLNAGRSSNGNIFQKLWVKRLDEAAVNLAKEQGISEAEAQKIVEEQFEKLTGSLGVENASFVGDIIAHADNGSIYRHRLHSLATNPNTSALYDAYRSGDRARFLGGRTLEDVEKDVLSDQYIAQQIEHVFGGGKDEFLNLFGKDYKDLQDKIEALRKLKEIKAELEHKYRIELREVDVDGEKIVDYETKLTENQQQIEAVTEELEKSKKNLLSKKATDQFGKTYKYTAKDLDQTIADMTDVSDQEQIYEEKEYEAAKDQLADYNKELKNLVKEKLELEAQLKKENLTEGEKRFLSAQLSRNKEAFEMQYGRYSYVRNIVEGHANTDKDKRYLAEMNFDTGGDNYSAFVDSTSRGIALSQRKENLSFYNSAYNHYKKQYKLEGEITENEEKQSEARLKNDTETLQILQNQHQILVDMLEIQKGVFDESGLKNVPGYSKETLDRAQRMAQLENEKDLKLKANQQTKTGGGSGSGGIGGFLGINAYTERWLSRLMNGGLLMSFIRILRTGLKDIINKAKQLDQVMTNLRIVTGKNATDARTLIGQYANLGKQLGATTVEITQMATAWSRQGYDMAQVSNLIESSMYLSKLGMIDATTAVKDLTSAMKGFKLEASEAMSIVDKLTALDVKAATTAGDIAEGLAMFANLANLNGVSLDQASAYVATIADVNQMSGSVVGQGLKTILSRYGNVKAGAYNKLNTDTENTDTTEKLNDVERVLNKMGISIRDTNLEFKDFDEVLDEIADKWETLDNVSKKAIANAFAGKHVLCSNIWKHMTWRLTN